MPFVGDLRLRLGPLRLRASAGFAARDGYAAAPSVTASDEARVRRAFLAAAAAAAAAEGGAEPGGAWDAQQRAQVEQLLQRKEGPSERELDGLELPVAALDRALALLGIDLSGPELRAVRAELLEPALSECLAELPHGDEGKRGAFAEGKAPENEGKHGLEEKQHSISQPQPPESDQAGGAPRASGAVLSFARFCRVVAEVYAPSYVYGKELNRAAARGDVAAVRQLVARGCSPGAADGRGMTALHYACEAGNVEAVKLLSELLPEAACNVQDQSGWTPSIAAAANGKAQVLPLLAKRKADLSLCTSAGRSALHWACCKGHLEAARALLAAGANAKAVDNSGLSCLHLAVLANSKAIVQALLKAGADPAQCDISGRVARDLCADETSAESLLGPLKDKDRKK